MADMTSGEARFEKLKKLILTASARTFGVSRSKFDWFLLVVLGCFAAAVSYVAVETESHATRLSAMVCAMMCMMSVLSVCRTSVPLVLQVSYADMLRIRRPFYVWTCCVVLVVCLSDPFLDLLSVPPVKMLPAVLTVLSVGQTLEYFREGRSWHLFLAFVAAGVAVGMSAFGFCALVLVMVVSFLVRRRMTSEFADESSARVIESIVDPYVQMMMRMVAVLCFFAGVLAAGAVRLPGLKAWSELVGCGWTCGLSQEGLMLILAAVVVPLAVALNGIGKVTDTLNMLGFANRVKYVLLGCAAACYLLASGLIRAKMHVVVVNDASYWMLGAVSAGFLLLLSAAVSIVDIWCRMPMRAVQLGASRNTPLSRLFRWMLVASPVGLAIVAGCIRYCFRN